MGGGKMMKKQTGRGTKRKKPDARWPTKDEITAANLALFDVFVEHVPWDPQEGQGFAPCVLTSLRVHDEAADEWHDGARRFAGELRKLGGMDGVHALVSSVLKEEYRVSCPSDFQGCVTEAVRTRGDRSIHRRRKWGVYHFRAGELTWKCVNGQAKMPSPYHPCRFRKTLGRELMGAASPFVEKQYTHKVLAAEVTRIGAMDFAGHMEPPPVKKDQKAPASGGGVKRPKPADQPQARTRVHPPVAQLSAKLLANTGHMLQHQPAWAEQMMICARVHAALKLEGKLRGLAKAGNQDAVATLGMIQVGLLAADLQALRQSGAVEQRGDMEAVALGWPSAPPMRIDGGEAKRTSRHQALPPETPPGSQASPERVISTGLVSCVPGAGGSGLSDGGTTSGTDTDNDFSFDLSSGTGGFSTDVREPASAQSPPIGE